MNKTIIAPVAQIIELGKATNLTMGYAGNLSENYRPNQHTSGGVVVSGDRR